MLRKLIKYEFKASGRILLPIFIATFVLALLSGIFNTSYIYNNAPFNFAVTLVQMIFIMFVIAISIICIVVPVYRFKKNLFDSEGYLMHTLPVKPHTHITSKLIVAVIYQVIGAVVAILSVAVFLIFADAFQDIDLTELKELLAEYQNDVIIYIVEIILLLLSYLVHTTMVFFSAISIGHSANKHRVAKSVGVYILIYFAEQFIRAVIPTNLFDIEGLLNETSYLYSAVFLQIVIFIIFTAALYALTNYFMKAKLNLQ